MKYMQIVLKVQNWLHIQKYVQIVLKVHNRLNVQNCGNCHIGAKPLTCNVKVVLKVHSRLNVWHYEICANYL